MKFISKELGVLFSTACLGVMLLQTATVAAQMSPPIDIPFRTSGASKCLLFSTQLDGRLNTNCMFDTGANGCLISDKLVVQLGLTPMPAVMSNGKPIRDLDGKQFQAVAVPARIGSWQRLITFMVVEDKRLQLIDGTSVGALLGATILFDSSIYLDFEHQQVKFFDAHSPSQDDFKALAMNNATCLPLLNADKFEPTLHVRLSDEVELDMRLDTGADTTILSASVVSKLHLKNTSKS